MERQCFFGSRSLICVGIIVGNIYDVWGFQNVYKMFYLNFFVISILLSFYRYICIEIRIEILVDVPYFTNVRYFKANFVPLNGIIYVALN